MALNDNPNPLLHRDDSSVLIIKFVGVAVVMGMTFLGISLWLILWQQENRELAIITGLIGAISNPISLGIGVLIPSPLSNKRSVAAESPSGNIGDPVAVTNDTTVSNPETGDGIATQEEDQEVK